MAEQFGYNVGNALEDILARQQNQKRQAMIDEINRRNIESEISARNESAASQAEVRAAAAENRRSEVLKRHTDLLAPGQELEPEDSKYLQGAAPSLIKQGAPAVPAAQIGDDNGSAEQFGEIPAGKPTYRGRPDQLKSQHEQQVRDEARKVMNSPAFAGLSDVQKWDTIREATGAAPPESVISPKPAKKGGNLFIIDQHGKVTDTGTGFKEDGPTFRVLGREPAGSATATTPQLWYNDEVDPNDPTGKTTIKVPYSMTPGELQQYGFDPKFKVKNGTPGGVRKGNLPNTPIKPETLYDVNALKLYQATLANKQTTTPQERMAKLNGFINTIHDPDVKKAVQAIISNPQAFNTPIADLISGGILNGDEADVQKAASVLSAIRGK